MPYYRLVASGGPHVGVRPIVLKRCKQTHEVLYAIDDKPRDIPPDLVAGSSEIFKRLGYRLLTSPLPGETANSETEEVS